MVNSGPITGIPASESVARTVAWLEETERGEGAVNVSPARLADLAPALLGHADPDRVLCRLWRAAGAGGSTADRTCPKMSTSCRPASRR